MLIFVGLLHNIVFLKIYSGDPSEMVPCKDIFKIVLFMYLFYFWLRRIFIAMHRLFLAAESKGYSLVALCGFLFAAASRCRAQALECMLNSCGSLV